MCTYAKLREATLSRIYKRVFDALDRTKMFPRVSAKTTQFEQSIRIKVSEMNAISDSVEDQWRLSFGLDSRAAAAAAAATAAARNFEASH